jgi:cyclopropane-fatty-acyl-phospholipid synthase
VLNRAIPALHAGRLHVVLPNGETVTRDGAAPGPEGSILIRHWRGAWRILLDSEEGAARGYIDGDWTTPDLAQLLALGMHNEAAVSPQAKWRLPAQHRRALRSRQRFFCAMAGCRHELFLGALSRR